MRGMRGTRHRDDLPGADDRAQPALHRRQPDRRSARAARGAAQERGARARAIELLARTGIPDPERRVDAYPAPALGRPAPARDDRDGARLPAQAADRRRADHRARRHDPGADPRPARRAAGRDGHGAPVHHPRPQPGAPLHPSRRRDGARPAGRAAAPPHEVFARPAAPLHAASSSAAGRSAWSQPLAADAPVLLAADDVERRLHDRARAGSASDAFDAVRHATLQLRRGETLGIVGESGSGKTTLGMALLALQPIAAGAGRARRPAHRRRRPHHAARDAPAHAGRVPGSVRLAQPAHDDRARSSARAGAASCRT